MLKLKATHSNIHKLVNFFGLKNPEELYYKVGLGVIDNGKLLEYARETSGLLNYFKQRIVKSNYAKTKLDEKTSKPASDHLMLVFDTDEHEMDYTLAKCCNPLPGDRVFGLVTTADGLKVLHSSFSLSWYRASLRLFSSLLDDCVDLSAHGGRPCRDYRR